LDPQYLNNLRVELLSMGRTTRLACLATMTVLFSGCQQMAWKPGASSADLDRDTAACEADHAEQTAVQDCLRKRGWVIRIPKPTEEELVDSPAEPDAVPAPVAVGAGTPAAAVAPAMPATGAAAPAIPAAEPRSGTAVAPRNKSVPKPVDPMRRSEIQAWWKMGGQADALTSDMDSCVGQLGPEHKPDLQKKLYTRGLIDCLKGKGWFGR
jgi:hypothetical protein